MTLVTLSLPEKTYQRVKQWADWQQQEVSEAIADYLTNTLPEIETDIVPAAQPDEAVEREEAAYIRLHPQLKKTHLNKYVAIYHGQLVDEDANYGALLERIDVAYPNLFVWMIKVENQPIKTLSMPSFRLEQP